MKCPICNYEWKNRKPNPKECPQCKGRLQKRFDMQAWADEHSKQTLEHASKERLC